MEPELSEQEEAYFKTGGAEPLGDDPEEAPVEAEAPEPEAPEPEEPEAAKEDEPEEPKTVPIAALHEARDQAKALKEQLEKREADFNKLTGRLDILETLAKNEPQAEELPNWDENPLDAGKALDQKVISLEQRLMQEDQARQLQQTVITQENTFRADHPDYDQAVKHLSETRERELAIYGFDPGQARQQIAMEAQQLSLAALRMGKNPAEVAYELAKQRGYALAEEPKPEPKKPDESAKLDAIERGQSAGRSAAAAGGAPPVKTTLDALMDMDDSEFAKVAEGDWRKIWG